MIFVCCQHKKKIFILACFFHPIESPFFHFILFSIRYFFLSFLCYFAVVVIIVLPFFSSFVCLPNSLELIAVFLAFLLSKKKINDDLLATIRFSLITYIRTKLQKWNERWEKKKRIKRRVKASKVNIISSTFCFQ